MTLHRITAAALVAALGLATNQRQTIAQSVFVPTTGAQVWNDDNNWGPGPPQPFPNAIGAAATLPAPTGELTVELGQSITLASLTITKSQTAVFGTTITAATPNGFVFDGGGTVATTPSFGTGGGLSLITAPVATSGLLTITQGDDQILRFEGAISGSGAVTVNRTNDANNLVAFNGTNTYAGATTVAGSGSTNFGVLRLNNPLAVPGGLNETGGTSNITLTNSAILGLGSTDFRRSIGTGPDQIQFVTAGNSGFAAFDGTRIVNLGGAAAPIAWTTAGFGTLTFGYDTASGTIDFQNPLSFGNANRTIRVIDGSAPIDARISAPISSTGAANSFTKNGNGTLSLSAANTYTGATIVAGGVLRLDHPQALPANTNLTLAGAGANNNGVLNLAVGDFAATLGTGPGQLQFGTGNAGFAATGGDRKVTLNGGATLVWGGGFNVGGNLILSDEGADSTVEFTNALDLNGGSRQIATRDGTADIDARITGVISGAGNLIKSQAGTLELPIANAYTGTTAINAGVLLLKDANSIPGGVTGGSVANISFDGGIVGLGQSDFTAPLGAGPGQVQFLTVNNGNGGFAAYGANRTVNIGGASAPLTWATGGFVSGNLLLSAAGSDGTVDFQNPIDLNGAQRIIAARPGDAEIDAIVSGVITGTGGILQKNGNGTLSFPVANTYDGGTIIEDGRLLASNTTGSAVGTGDVTVTSNGTLGGNGFVGTAGDASNVLINAGGRIAPGLVAGKLSVTGNVTFEVGSFFDLQLGGTTPATQFDQLAIDGAATLAGSITVNLLNGYVPAAGTSFEVLNATGGVAGTFDPLAPSNGIVWETAYGANTLTLVSRFAADFNNDGQVTGGDLETWKLNVGLATGATRAQGDADADGDVDGSDFLAWQRYLGIAATPAIATVAAVPEPTSVALCSAAITVLLAGRHRNERRASTT
jgi:autotransporter-associated beta strand protein